MMLRILVAGLVWTLALCAQKKSFSWQDACFNNPSAPYCPGRDFAVKPTKAGALGVGTAGTMAAAPVVDATGIDWRFADPSADALAVLSGNKLSGSKFAHSLIDQFGASIGFNQTEMQNVFRGLLGADYVAISIRDEKVVLMIVGRAPDSILPAPEAGWKAASLAGNAMILGHNDAVDQASKRLLMPGPLGEFALAALERKGDSEFWAIGSAKLAGQQAPAGVKRFSVTASLLDQGTSDTVFEFDGAPVAHVKASTDSFSQIAASPLGQSLGILVKSSRFLPVRDTATTVHTKPVIFGLEDGPREVKQYAPSAPIATVVPAPAATAAPVANQYSWVIQSTMLTQGKYSMSYYEGATNTNVEKPLNLPAGASIIGVFPDNCAFSAKNQWGNAFTYQNEAEARGKTLGAGTWSVYPANCGGVAVFLK